MSKVNNGVVNSLRPFATPKELTKKLESNFSEDKQNRELIKEWISQVVPNNPLFCDKQGTMRICHYFLTIHYGNEFVSNLPPNIGSRIGTVTRGKNKFLKANPIYDLRPQRKKKNENTPSLFDELQNVV